MPEETFDVAVIGGGSAGYVGAIRGAQLGLRVAVIEKEKVGGTCLHRGCIPTKSFLHGSELAHQIKGAGSFGLKATPAQVDWPQVLRRKEAVVDQLYRGVEFLLKKNNVVTLKGEGIIEAGDRVRIKGDGSSVTARHLVVATGSQPKSLPGLDMDGDRVINSDHAVALQEIPKSVLIVGAGAVGVEFACVYNGFGSEVTLVEFLPTLLPQEDAEVGQLLARILSKRGIKVLTGAQVQPETLKRSGSRITVSAKVGERTETLEAERILVAVGREGITQGFGLEKLDVQVEKGYLKADEHYRTGHPNVYAAGDVIGNYLLAHVAYYEGKHIMEHIAGNNPKPLDYTRVPRATYSYPQVASLGFSEQQARDQGLNIKVGKFPMVANSKAVILGETDGFVKLVSDADSGDLLGVFILASNAAELISEAALAKLLESTPWEIGASIHPHPTVSESVGEAALAVDRLAIHV